MVLASDGQHSYVSFIYGVLLWGAENASIRFQFDGNSLTPGILSDIGTVASRSNIGVNGTYLFQINDGLVEPPGKKKLANHFLAIQRNLSTYI